MDATQPFPGDWEDLTAAAGVGAQAISAAVEASEIGEDKATFEFRDVAGRPIVLEVSRVGDGLLSATAQAGRFGDEETEQRLLNAFAHRLEQLHGVAYAPR